MSGGAAAVSIVPESDRRHFHTHSENFIAHDDRACRLAGNEKHEKEFEKQHFHTLSKSFETPGTYTGHVRNAHDDRACMLAGNELRNAYDDCASILAGNEKHEKEFERQHFHVSSDNFITPGKDSDKGRPCQCRRQDSSKGEKPEWNNDQPEWNDDRMNGMMLAGNEKELEKRHFSERHLPSEHYLVSPGKDGDKPEWNNDQPEWNDDCACMLAGNEKGLEKRHFSENFVTPGKDSDKGRPCQYRRQDSENPEWNNDQPEWNDDRMNGTMLAGNEKHEKEFEKRHFSEIHLPSENFITPGKDSDKGRPCQGRRQDTPGEKPWK